MTMAKEAAATSSGATVSSNASNAKLMDVDRRLREAFPEINIEQFGEKLKAVGGTHNLQEKWDSLVREFDFWMDLAQTYSKN